MPFDPHLNLRRATVSVAPSPATSGTSLIVDAGSVFPATALGAYNLLVWPNGEAPTTQNAEIIRVTTRTVDTLNPIVRAQEGSSARSIVIGDQVALAPTAKTFTDIETAVTALEAAPPAHGHEVHTNRVRYIPLEFDADQTATAVDSHGSIGGLSHIDVADGVSVTIYFKPTVLPSDFVSWNSCIVNHSETVGGGNIVINALIETLNEQNATAGTLCWNTGDVAYACNATANTTQRTVIAAANNPTSADATIQALIIINKAHASDSNTGAAAIWGVKLSYNADS